MSIAKLKDPWISISDMMTGLMMIFLFITVSYAHQITKQSENAISKNSDVKEIVLDLINNKSKISESLHREFDKDLEKWGASIDDQNLRIRFESPEVLFKSGKSEVTPLFNEILSDFWPRYLKILSENEAAILEIKIEGHTSSDWSTNVSRNESYFKNMELSQDRSRNVLEICLQYTPKDLMEWSRNSVTVNGSSFSRLIYDELGEEDPEKSRRVEFTILVRSDEKFDDIEEIL